MGMSKKKKKEKKVNPYNTIIKRYRQNTISVHHSSKYDLFFLFFCDSAFKFASKCRPENLTWPYDEHFKYIPYLLCRFCFLFFTSLNRETGNKFSVLLIKIC